MNPLRRVLSWFNHHKQRIGVIAIGHSVKRTEEVLFDWVLYGVVITWATTVWGTAYGAVVTFLILTPLSALISWLEIIFYDWAKKDWLGLELLKEFRDEEKHEHWLGRLIHRITRWGHVPAFFVLSVHSDAFITTAYFRPKHRQYHGMTRRDWGIFGASIAVSNLYWTLRWTVIVTVLSWMWAHVLAPLWY